MKGLPQADTWLPRGLRRKIGGLRTYGQRLSFYLGILNTATLMILAYQNVELIGEVFPSVLIWLIFLGVVVVPAIVSFDYLVLHPSQITYNSHQQAMSSRNPAFQLIEENNRMLKENTPKTDGGNEDTGAPGE